MAEIEHFLDPTDKSHPKFESIASQKMNFYSAANQMNGLSAEEHTIGDAVSKVLSTLDSPFCYTIVLA